MKPPQPGATRLLGLQIRNFGFWIANLRRLAVSYRYLPKNLQLSGTKGSRTLPPFPQKPLPCNQLYISGVVGPARDRSASFTARYFTECQNLSQPYKPRMTSQYVEIRRPRTLPAVNIDVAAGWNDSKDNFYAPYYPSCSSLKGVDRPVRIEC